MWVPLCWAGRPVIANLLRHSPPHRHCMLYTINYSHTVLSYKMDKQLNRENHHQPVKKELSYRKPLDAKKSEKKMRKKRKKLSKNINKLILSTFSIYLNFFYRYKQYFYVKLWYTGSKNQTTRNLLHNSEGAPIQCFSKHFIPAVRRCTLAQRAKCHHQTQSASERERVCSVE